MSEAKQEFKPEKSFLSWMQKMGELKGSDIYLTCGSRPIIRYDGGFFHCESEILTKRYMELLIGYMMTPEKQGDFSFKKELNMSLNIGNFGRFRVNCYIQKGNPALVMRRIVTKIPTLEELKLPVELGKLCLEKRGLIIMVGATGSGKSTSLAAMLDYRNATEEGHILTIEDPIEYVHNHKKCIVSQREIGTDTLSFEAALENSLRQKPDVILVGEIRDAYVMKQALNICETGHLALATLHANNADQAIERILSFFPLDEHRKILLNLSFNLKAMLSQRLVKTLEGKRTVALEIMLGSPDISDLIRVGDTKSLKAIIEKNRDIGMQSFDQHLLDHYHNGIISRDVLIAESDNRLNILKILEGES